MRDLELKQLYAEAVKDYWHEHEISLKTGIQSETKAWYNQLNTIHRADTNSTIRTDATNTHNTNYRKWSLPILKSFHSFLLDLDVAEKLVFAYF